MAETARSMETDVVVIGSGAGGMSAAICAALLGLKVVVVEKAAVLGGCTAFSGGIPWVPANHQMDAAGMPDSTAAALRYLRHTVGPSLREEMVQAYLETAPKMLAFMEAKSAVRFRMRPDMPDYASEADGATRGGRCLEPVPYDGRELGAWFARLRQPRVEMTVFGGMMVNAADVRHLLAARRSWASARHSIGLVVRYAIDRLRHQRGTRLVAGNALAARLLRSALDAGVEFWNNAPAQQLLTEGARVTGVRVERDGALVDIRARAGTVLATGGFPQNNELRARYIPHAQQHRSMAPTDNAGDGIALAQRVGAVMDAATPANAFFTPVSVLRRPDGSERTFPHLITDRAKPGAIAVNAQGRRFANEAESYHDFVRAMQGDGSADAAAGIPAYLVCDARFLRTYGLGMVRPAPFPRRAFVDAGYLLRGSSLAELAQRMQVDAAALETTVRAYNQDARAGKDSAFGKGSTGYNRYMGDATHPPGPCNAPLEEAPFYAVRLYTGDIGTSLGIRTNTRAQALDGAGQPIDGLYVCGNDMTSIMVGTYATGGITIGPALTFGYLAAHHIHARQQAGYKDEPPLQPPSSRDATSSSPAALA